MIRFRRLARPAVGLTIALLAAGACQQRPSVAMQAQIDSLSAAAAERDQLLMEMADNARFVSEVSAELAQVQVRGRKLQISSESPMRASRDSVVQKIKYITTRLNETESRLRQNQQRIAELTTLSDSLKTALEQTLANYQQVVDDQRATIEALTAQVQGLEGENIALRDTVSNLSMMTNTVYVAVGTKDELLRRGLVVEEGGARVLFIFGRAGKTLAPARDLDPDEFTAVNKREVTEIPLPDPTKTYRIASRQNPEFLATPPNGDGTVSGRLVIAQPEQFWANSKFLILVEQGRVS